MTCYQIRQITFIEKNGYIRLCEMAAGQNNYTEKIIEHQLHTRHCFWPLKYTRAQNKNQYLCPRGTTF